MKLQTTFLLHTTLAFVLWVMLLSKLGIPLILICMIIPTIKAQEIVVCASGYTGSNVYLSGKNTLYRGFDNQNTIYYYTNGIPLGSDRPVFIWKNDTSDIYVFVTLPDPTDIGKHIPMDGYVFYSHTVLNINSQSRYIVSPLTEI